MIFRPSSRMRLTLRTEEFSSTEDLEGRLPSPFGDGIETPSRLRESPFSPETPTTEQLQEQLEANQNRLRELERRRDSLPIDQYIEQREQIRAERDQVLRQALANTDSEAEQPPTSVNGDSGDDLTVIGDILPISVQIERNGLNTAATATVVMNYTDAPFDPRVIRAAHVEILVGVVEASDYEAGVERGETRQDGSILSVVGAQEDGSLLGATRFVGFVDSWGVKYSTDGDTVTLECRDMSAPFRDIKLNPGESIDLTQPIEQGVQGFVDSISAYVRGVRVRYLGEGDPPTPSESAPTRRVPRRGRRNRRTRRSGQNMTLWDHITDVVRGLGLLPIVRDFELLLVEPRTLYSTLGTRRMVYGRNIESLEFTRRLSGVKVPTIEVRSYDPEIGRTRWGRYPVRSGEQASGIMGLQNPPRALRANEVPPSGANPDESIRTIIVSRVSDPGLLERVARNYFEQVGRQEIEGTFSTADVSSFDVDPNIADLLLLQAGDPVELLIASGDPNGGEDESQPNSTLAQIEALSRQQRRNYFVSIGWSEEVADRFAVLQDVTGFQTVFRVQDVRIGWDNDQGVVVNCGFINYVTVREDQAEEEE